MEASFVSIEGQVSLGAAKTRGAPSLDSDFFDSEWLESEDSEQAPAAGHYFNSTKRQNHVKVFAIRFDLNKGFLNGACRDLK